MLLFDVKNIVGKIAFVDENVSIELKVKATDLDEGVNGQIKYSITGGDQKEHFSVDPDSGLITTAQKLDYETKKSYQLTVKGIADVIIIICMKYHQENDITMFYTASRMRVDKS